jgi:phosphatidylglycerol:prolipoprotein diacylglycerol transferase
MNGIACAVVLVGALVCARLRGIAPLVLLRLWPWVILGGVGGAHLYYLAAGSDVPWTAYSTADVLDVFQGSAIQGGFSGRDRGVVYLRLAGAPVLAVLDVLARPGRGAGADRVGCFSPAAATGADPIVLAVVYDDPRSLGPRGVRIHPAQLYESAALVILAAGLVAFLRRRDVPDGRVFTSYLAGYGVIRFLVQFFRGDDVDRLVLGLAHSQYAALAMLLVAAFLWSRRPRPRGS